MTHNYQTASMLKRIIAFLIDAMLVLGVASAFLFVRMGTTPDDMFIDEGKPGLADKYPFIATAEAVTFDPQRGVYLESFLKNFTMDAIIAFLLLPMLYFVIFEGLWGGTIGKLMTGIRVRRKDGGKISFGVAFVRFMGKRISTFVFIVLFLILTNYITIALVISALIYIFGYLLAIFDNKRQALHDKIANTLVLNKGTGI